jgi:FAD/FMN-containing dehydrogenase
MTGTLTPTLSETTLEELRQGARGDLIAPRDAAYEQATTIWNGMHDGRRPALIVRCAGAADVIATVGFARDNDLAVAVRGGGHSVAGFSTCDDGIVIDLSALRHVHVDPATRRAYVGGGAVWADVDHETQAHGLATTGGLISTTGVAGFTLGGGIGWLMRKHGLACDNLTAATVVTADGRLVRASESEYPDLFWGLRGGGGNFGVVTQFELALHPVGPIVQAGPIFFPAEHAGTLLRLYREWVTNAPDHITTMLGLVSAPPLPVIPAAWHGRPVAALLSMSVGSAADAEEAVRPFRAAAEPFADLFGPMPYNVMQTLVDQGWQKGIRAYFKAANLARLDDQLIDRLCELHLEVPGPQCEIHVHQMGGAVARVPEDATAFAERSMPFVLNAITGWHDPSLTEQHIEWARTVAAAASNAGTGRAYVNFVSDPDAAPSCYSPDTYARLAALKSDYDPTNLFQLNQNITPAR